MFTERRLTSCVALILTALLAACNGTSSYLDATGAAGHSEAMLGQWLTGVACAVVLLVCLAILWGIARHRGERDASSENNARTERRQIRSGLSWIYIGIAATLVILLVTFTGTMVTLNAASHPPRVPSLEIDVTGHQWWWELRYQDRAHPEQGFVTANEIHLPVGIPVRVRLQSADVIHSFWLPQIAGKTDVIPGQVNEMWVEAKRPGTTRGACAEYCGLQHAMMALPVVAESPEKFAQWTAQRRADAVSPSNTEAHAGEIVFRRTCGVCHAVEGTNALGRVGPDLTHFASRPSIGAGIMRNTPANLMTWIVNAPAVKEGARMPAMPLDAADLQAVVAYLQTLR